MAIKLEFIGGPREGETVEVTTFPAVLGRGEDCTVPLKDPMASRHHCEIRESADGPVLVDLESKNGTLVNFTPATEWPLQDGDEIMIGDTRLRVRTPESAASDE